MSLGFSKAAYRIGWKFRRLLEIPDDAWAGIKRRAYGYHAWPTLDASVRNNQAGHPDLR